MLVLGCSSANKLIQPLFCLHRLLWWFDGKEPTCRCKRRGFHPWVWNIPCRRKWQPTPIFLPGEPLGQRRLMSTVHGVTNSRSLLTAHEFCLYPNPTTTPHLLSSADFPVLDILCTWNHTGLSFGAGLFSTKFYII